MSRQAKQLNFHAEVSCVFEPEAKPKENAPFLCDLMLLPGPSVNAVPRQGRGFALKERGHVLNECQFYEAMTEVELVLLRPSSIHLSMLFV